MQIRQILIRAAVGALFAAAALPVWADGRVQLELVGDARGAALSFQEWARVLNGAGVQNVRIRSAKATDQVGIEVRGTEDRPLYVVTGVVKSRDELLLPPGRFTRRDVARLARWLDDLAQQGPAERPEPTSAFGLKSKQFEQVHADMARPVGFSTQGVTRDVVVEKIGRRLELPLQFDAELARALREDQVGEELSALSCGTALAYVLRPMGLCFVPRRVGQGVVYVVATAKPGLEVWPVGWKPEKPRREALPALFEFHSINIQGVSADKTLAAIGKRLKVPVLIDHNALARHGIELSKVNVSHPRSRTTYSLALQKILFQAQLKSEVRLDEAGQPFLWISTLKPV